MFEQVFKSLDDIMFQETAAKNRSISKLYCLKLGKP